jgi:hypothetical protein
MWLMFIYPNQLEVSTLFDYLTNSGIQVQYPILMIGAFTPRSPAGDARGSYFIRSGEIPNKSSPRLYTVSPAFGYRAI